MARTQLKFQERRLASRRRLTGLMPGRLIFATSRQDIACKPVDVSENGMGIVVADQKQEIEPGIELLLVLQDCSIRLLVAWGTPDFGKQDYFRYGLVTVDPKDNLETLFIESGCLK